MNAVNENKINMHRVPDIDNLAEKALDIFTQISQEAVKNRGVFYIAISGGHTPVLLYEKLANQEASKIQWDKVHVFWVDERCVSPAGADSNFGLAARTFLQHVPIPTENVHRVIGEVENYKEAARNYEREIRSTMTLEKDEKPLFDLIILGMGADGHIGSIFPNTYALFDADDLVCTVYRLEGDHSRITLTVPVIKSARRLMILVSGKEKAQTLKKIFSMEPDPVLYPIHSLWPVLDKVTWVVDEEAAALL